MRKLRHSTDDREIETAEMHLLLRVRGCSKLQNYWNGDSINVEIFALQGLYAA
jgi:hypothetical protein